MGLGIRMAVPRGEEAVGSNWRGPVAEGPGSGTNVPFLVLDLVTPKCLLYDNSLSSTFTNYVLFSVNAGC